MPKFAAFKNAALVLLAAMVLSPAAMAQSAFDDPGSRAQGGQGGDLKPVNEKNDAGSVTLGSSGQAVILFRNDDSKPIKTGAINLYPSSNISASIGENQCAMAPIAPGEICAISLQIKGLQQGKFRIEMLMRHDGRAKLLTSTIDGNVDATGADAKDLVSDLETIPNSVDFGTLDESRPQVKAIILRNKTSKPIKISTIDVAAGSQSGFSIESNCDELATGEACVGAVTWSPEQRGPSSGTLIVRHSGATGVSTIELKGAYDPEVAEKATVFPEAIPGKGLLVSSSEQIDFGSGVSRSASITSSLVNVGDVPLTITGIHMTNSDNGVKTEQSGCKVGDILTPLEACPLTLTWEPVREGSIVDDVQVSHTGARGILVLPLRGNAAKPVNRDSKAIMLGEQGPEAIINKIQPLSLDEIEDDGEVVMEDGDKAMVKKPKGSKPSKSTSKNAASDGADDEGEPSSSDGKKPSTSNERSMPKVDVRGILDGYTITSYSAQRAIVSGPGGSRVVFNGEQAVIGGVLWTIVIRPSAVEFQNGDQKVLLLFDRSLSSVNLVDTQSTSGGSTTATTSSTTSTSSSGSTSTP